MLGDTFTPKSLANLDIETLKFLKTEVAKREGWGQLFSDAGKAIALFNERKQFDGNWTAEFESRCEIKSTANDHGTSLLKYRLFYGGKIKASSPTTFESVSYFIAVCKTKGDRLQLLRKFHFDYEPNNAGQWSKPCFHLQYGGKLTEAMLSCNELANKTGIFSEYSIPRISIYPMSLCLLINIVLREFGCNETNSIREEKGWKELVLENERNLIRPFFGNISPKLTGDQCFHDLMYQ